MWKKDPGNRWEETSAFDGCSLKIEDEVLMNDILMDETSTGEVPASDVLTDKA